jgi:hypothetical protein
MQQHNNLSDDGPSEIMTEAKISSFKGKHNNCQKEEGLVRVAEICSLMGHRNNFQMEKGLEIISGAGDFDEIIGGKFTTTKNLEK